MWKRASGPAPPPPASAPPATADRPDTAALRARLHRALAAAGCSLRPALAVSGGADSLCLAFLAAGWGEPLALVVDHGLRDGSSAEARLTAERLAAIGIPSRILTLHGLARGPALAERARKARYAALRDACRLDGRVDLLLGHHRRDQAETVLMRQSAGSGPSGRAGMAQITEWQDIRLLRPLLDEPPGLLRMVLAEAALGWAEDPSNADQTALRARLRAALGDPAGDGPRIIALAAEANSFAAARRREDARIAAELAARTSILPEGYAVLSAGPVSAGALAALLRCISGSAYPASPRQVSALAAAPRPSVLSGVRLLAAGRLGRPGDLLLVREEAAIGPPSPAEDGAIWDGRFRLIGGVRGGVVGAAGEDAARLRAFSTLPSAVLRTLPVIRVDGALAELPHIGYPDVCGSDGPRAINAARVAACFVPPTPASGAPFGA